MIAIIYSCKFLHSQTKGFSKTISRFVNYSILVRSNFQIQLIELKYRLDEKTIPQNIFRKKYHIISSKYKLTTYEEDNEFVKDEESKMMLNTLSFSTLINFDKQINYPHQYIYINIYNLIAIQFIDFESKQELLSSSSITSKPQAFNNKVSTTYQAIKILVITSVQT